MASLATAAPSELVDQLQAAARRIVFWPFVLVAAVALLALGTVGLILELVAIPTFTWTLLRDRARRSVVVFYDVNDEPATKFAALVTAVEGVQAAQRVWFVPGQGEVRTTYQYKVNSGAGTIIQRHSAVAAFDGPKELVANIAVPTLRCGKRAVYFLPDRVILRDGKAFADVPYQTIRVESRSVRFIETERVPGDSRRVDTTWRYVNVKGGPDRRFKDNRQLPVMLYGRMTLVNTAGLHLVWDCSRPEAVDAVVNAIRNAAAALPTAKTGASSP